MNISSLILIPTNQQFFTIHKISILSKYPLKKDNFFNKLNQLYRLVHTLNNTLIIEYPYKSFPATKLLLINSSFFVYKIKQKTKVLKNNKAI